MIILKVKFFETVDHNKEDSIRNTSFRKLSETQRKKNMLRSKSFRENQPKRKRKLSSESTEMPRNDEFSTPEPKLDPLDCFDSVCCDEKSTSHIDDKMVIKAVSCSRSCTEEYHSSFPELYEGSRSEKSELLLDSESKIEIDENVKDQPTPFDSDTESN